MPKQGMDVRMIGLLTSSDYSTLPTDEYVRLQTSIGRKSSEILYETLAQKGFEVNFTATAYEIINELIRIATHLMFGSELQVLNMKYDVQGDLCFLEITVKKCPICEYIKSTHPTCNLLSGFFTGLIELFFLRFAVVKVDSREESCIAAGDSYCRFVTRWCTPLGIPPPQKLDLEIHIDEQALKKKMQEIENLDFYKRVVAYTRQRRTHDDS